MDLNRVSLIGNLIKDPETKTFGDNKSLVALVIATNRQIKDSKGEKKEETLFHNVVSFGKVSEIIAKYLKKGSRIYLEGRLNNRKWEDKNKVTHYTTNIVAENLIMLSKPNKGATNLEEKQVEEMVDIEEVNF